MSASTLNPTTYNNVAANTVNGAVLDAAAILAWYQNIKTVVDQHAGEVNGKLDKSGGMMSGSVGFAGSNGFLFRLGNSDSFFYMVDFPELTSASAEVRMFRNTNTTGEKRFYLYKGDGTATGSFAIINGEITQINGSLCKVTAGNGSPEGVVTANPGSVYLNRTGGAGVSFYVKQSGTGNTGWAAK